jgi:hypothetical protein
LRYDLIKPDVEGSSYLAWKIANGRLVYVDENGLASTKVASSKVANILSSKNQASIKVASDFSRDLLEMLNKVQNAKFGDSFYYDVMYMLEHNKLTHLYNIGSIGGIDTAAFKEDYNKFKESIAYDNEYLKQVNLGYKRQLDLVKRKSIAFDKFGVDSILNLSAKQKAIVELELKKLESIDTGGESNRLLWAKLRAGMLEQTNTSLKAAIKSIEEAISKKDLDGMMLLSGGVCPHLYQQAVTSLDKFINLRDYLIENFALPGDTSGYFCKICGEHIALADNTSVMKFTGERGSFTEDDPLQTMIWKEAMYIVNTNIRFTTPMPIKPLVNSLASGLRNQIAAEESKLYRSKTNTGDSIKDSLNLYACIYIYASLCALMMNNPGKLIFARDPPSDWKRKNGKTDTTNRKSNGINEDGKDDSINGINDNSKDGINDNSKDGINDNSKDGINDNSKDGINDNSKDGNDEADDEADKLDEAADEETTTANKPQIAVAAGERGYSRNRLPDTRKRKHRKIRGGRMVTDAKEAEKFYLTTALKLIFLSKETTISRLKNMNIDVIKQIFIKNAYGWAMKHAKPIQIDEESDRQTKDNPVILDSFYRYVYLANRLSGVRLEYNDVNRVLGAPEETIIKFIKDDISMYSKVNAPKPWSFGDAVFDDYTYRSYLAMLEYYNESLYRKNFIPRHVQVTEYLEKYADLLEIQFGLRMKMAKKQLRPNIDIPLQTDLSKYNKFDQHLLDLAQHYCPNGDQHKTGVYVYYDGKNTVELSKKDIVNWLESNNTAELEKFAKMKITNERCEKCKNLFRNAKSTTADKTFSSMFKKIDDLLAFYQYYETRCPKGNLHEFEDSICKLCKMHTDYVKKLEPSYYAEFSKGFIKIQKEKLILSIKSLESLKNMGSIESQQEVPAYQFSLKKTAEWSHISETKYNILVNIGLFEGVKYEQINSSQINPSKTATASRTRAMRIKQYVLSTLRDYNIVINHENIIDIPIELKEIIDAQKKIDIKDLSNNIPHFDAFTSLDDIYKIKLTVTDYTNFLLEYLANIIVSISKDSSEKYQTLAKLLVTYFTNKIITSEKFISKPEPYFAKLDITQLEDNSEDEVGVSGDEWVGHQSDKSESEFGEEKEVETYENEIDNDGYDVENVEDIWETE